jgi:hypothetical protein
MKTRAFAIALFASLLPMPGTAFAEEKAMTMTITSTAFAATTSIPKRYTCEGGDVSPPPTSWPKRNWSVPIRKAAETGLESAGTGRAPQRTKGQGKLRARAHP